MEITLSIIARQLGRLFHTEANREEFNDNPIKAIMLWDGTKPETDHLYLVSAVEIDNSQESWEDCTLICLGIPNKKIPYSDCLCIKDDLNFNYVYNTVQKIMEEFYDWRKTIEELHCNVNSLQKLVFASQDYLNMSLFINDKDYRYLAYTDDYMEKHGDAMGKEIFNVNMLNQMIIDPVFLAAKEHTEPFLYPGKENEFQLCYNIRAHGSYTARILSETKAGKYTQGDRKLLTYLGAYITELFEKDEESDIQKKQRDIFNTLIEDILVGKIPEHEKATPILRKQGWLDTSVYQVMVFDFMDAGKVEFSKNYYCDYLERLYVGSCALRNFEHIILIVNRSLLGQKDKILQQELSYFLRDSMCKIGASNIFSNLVQISYYYKQAEAALTLGEQKKDMKWIYHFGDHRFDFLLQQCTKTFKPEHVCNPILFQLRKYDQKEDTDLYHTLFIYIDEKFNATHAAKRLFIHRTTFLYRLERIKEITKIDSFDSWDLRLDLMLSYSLMK